MNQTNLRLLILISSRHGEVEESESEPRRSACMLRLAARATYADHIGSTPYAGLKFHYIV